MRHDVEAYVAACLVYQQIKYSTQAPMGFLQSLPVPALAWEEVMIDL